MRRTSMAAAAFMVLSGAALAQVSRTPDGKDVPYANQTPANAATTNNTGATVRTDIAGNGTDPSGSEAKTEPATPRR